MSWPKILLQVSLHLSVCIVIIHCNSCIVTSSPWARLTISCTSFEDLFNYQSPREKDVFGFTVTNETSYFICNKPMFHKFNVTLAVHLKSAGIIHVCNNCFEGMDGVRTIDLQENILTSIEMRAFRTATNNLEAIFLNFNYIEKIDFTGVEFPNLIDFQASNNHVKFVKLMDKNCPQISIMYLEKNLISKFQIESKSMETLHLSRNRIKKFKGSNLVLPNLLNIYLDDNVLSTITPDMFENMPNLKTIDLSHNHLHTTTFPTLKQITYINVKNNRLTTMDSMNCSALKNLNWMQFDSNNVTELNSDISYENVNRFSCIGCFIHTINPYFLGNSFKNLKSLDLVDNFLTTTNFFQTNDTDLKITRISLSYNKIRKIGENDFKRLPIASVIYMNDNEIVSIADGAFDSMVKLKTLDLSNNLLLRLPGNLFDNMIKLNILHLAGNNMAFFNIPGWNEETGEISSSKSIINQLKRLSISKNPLQCECVTLIRNWAGRNRIELWIDDYNVKNGIKPSCIINEEGCRTTVNKDYVKEDWHLFNDKKINITYNIFDDEQDESK